MVQDPRKESGARLLFRSDQTSRYRKLSLHNPIIIGALIVAFAVTLIFLLASRHPSRPAELTPASVGTIARKDIRATRDFTYGRVDENATAKIRAEAVASIPPIFRWEQAHAEASIQRLREVMRETRSDMLRERRRFLVERARRAQIEASLAAATPLPAFAERQRARARRLRDVLSHALLSGALNPVASPPQAHDLRARAAALAIFHDAARDGALVSGAAGASPTPDSTSTAEALRAHLDRYLEARYETFQALLDHTGPEVYVAPEVYQALVKHRFDEAIEDQVVALLRGVLSRPLLERPLYDLDQRGITLHVFDGVEVIDVSAEKEPSLLWSIEDAAEAIDRQPLRPLPGVPVTDQIALRELARGFIQPTLLPDEASTRLARAQAGQGVVELVVQQDYKRGQIIVDEGHVITDEHLAIYRAMIGDEPQGGQISRLLGLSLFLSLAMGGLMLLLNDPLRRHRPARRDLVFMGTVLLLMVVIARIGPTVLEAVGQVWAVRAPELTLLMIPFAAGAMMLRLVLGSASANAFAVVFALLLGLVVEEAQVLMPYALVSGVVGSLVLRHAKTRMMLLHAGFKIGLANAVCAVSLLLLMYPEDLGDTWLDHLTAPAFALSGGIFSAMLVAALLPMVENAFGYTTDIKLLELANLENPLLKELLIRAPGSYHHSMMVGSLNEAAAEAIGANSLLARVGAYYHDIGKMKNPQYFAENQMGDNPHDRLKPHMSALILKAHVKDGIELGKQHKLPQDLLDFIATHHGTSRIEYFYRKAREQAAPDDPDVSEQLYRYPGPRPQSREMGICMISDSVEAAVRSLPEKSPDRIKGMVQKLMNHKFADGQFDECDLTLADLNAIAQALLRLLTGIYHHRPEYPDKRRASASRPSRAATASVRPARRVSRPRAEASIPSATPSLEPAEPNAAPEATAAPASAKHSARVHELPTPPRVEDPPSDQLPAVIFGSGSR